PGFISFAAARCMRLPGVGAVSHPRGRAGLALAGVEDYVLPCPTLAEVTEVRQASAHNALISLAIPAGFEPATPCLEGRCPYTARPSASTFLPAKSTNNGRIKLSLSR